MKIILYNQNIRRRIVSTVPKLSSGRQCQPGRSRHAVGGALPVLRLASQRKWPAFTERGPRRFDSMRQELSDTANSRSYWDERLRNRLITSREPSSAREIRRVTSSSSPCRGRTWRSRGKTWRKRPSACHRRFSRRRLHSRHNTWRNSPPQWRRNRFAVRTTSHTACSNRRNPHSSACTWHDPFSHRPRARRSDGSTNRKSLGNPHKRLHISACGRSVDSRPRTRTRSRRREPQPPHPGRPFGNS